MKVSDFAGRCGEWLNPGEREYDSVVISSRVRLARNVSGFNFMERLDAPGRVELSREITDAIRACRGSEVDYFEIQSLDPLECSLLLERHLISRELLESVGPRGVAVSGDESLSLMVNEEDHLRMQALRGGFRLTEAYEAIDSLDDELSGLLNFAFSDELGYLTACPTNVGTGMRVSVMIHLPALVMTRHIEKAFRAIHDLRLAVRGFYGEGTEALGELYQISNQITLGRSEHEIIDDMQAVIEELASYELKARKKLLETERIRVEDRVWRALSILRSARLIASEEAMAHLSSLRMGIGMGLIPDVSVQQLNRIFIFSQPAHLQQHLDRPLNNQQRDEERAAFIRSELS